MVFRFGENSNRLNLRHITDSVFYMQSENIKFANEIFGTH